MNRLTSGAIGAVPATAIHEPTRTARDSPIACSYCDPDEISWRSTKPCCHVRGELVT